MKLYRKTEIMEFIYESEEEKNNHKKEMEQQGFEDSGQVKININQSLSNPQHEWYGKYFRYNNGYSYEEYKEANLRLAEIQSILENETDSFFEIGEEALIKEQDELEHYLYNVEQVTGWSW